MKYTAILPRLLNAIQIKSQDAHWKKEVASILALGQNATYKRLNGTTPFSIEQLAVLSQYYGFCVSEILFGDVEDSQNIPFHLPYKNSIQNFNDYISPILRDIRLLNHIPQATVWYTANEIPIFWYFHFKPLIKFKYFMWGRTTWKMNMMQGRKISIAKIGFTPQEIEQYQEVLEHYNTLESIEFWSRGILNTTIQQIKFCVKSNLFESKEDVEILMDSLLQLVQLLYPVLLSGKKNDKGNITVYENDITQANTCLYVDTPKNKTVYTVFKNPNLMSSTSKTIIKETEEWLQNIKNHSTRLTQSSEQHRLAFLNDLERQILSLKDIV